MKHMDLKTTEELMDLAKLVAELNEHTNTNKAFSEEVNQAIIDLKMACDNMTYTVLDELRAIDYRDEWYPPEDHRTNRKINTEL